MSAFSMIFFLHLQFKYLKNKRVCFACDVSKSLNFAYTRYQICCICYKLPLGKNTLCKVTPEHTDSKHLSKH